MYADKEHDGLRKDGQPDGRVGTGEFAHGKVDPRKAGEEGGKTTDAGNSSSDNNTSSNSGDSGGGKYKPTENDGLKEDGTPDGRVKGN
jgi:general stress protein YciG